MVELTRFFAPTENSVANLSTRINAAIDEGLMIRRDGKEPWNASRPLDGHTLRVFEVGNVLEEVMVTWLRLAGFDMRDTDPNTGRRFEFNDGNLRGCADGVILGGADLGVAYPWLVEIKTMHMVAWRDLVERGLKASAPTYFTQVQRYLHHLGFERCLLLALNKNSCDLHAEIVPLDVGYDAR
jgi:hypothetical protein